MKKFILLSVLGLGVSTVSFADADTDAKIYNAVYSALGGKKLTKTTLPSVLKSLKTQLLQLLVPFKNGEYKQFYNAVHALNVDNLIVAYIQMQAVVNHAPAETRSYIKDVLKAHGF